MKNYVASLPSQAWGRITHLLTREKRMVLWVPYVWLLVLFFIPFLMVLKISFSESQLAIPPFLPMVDWTADQVLKINVNFSRYWTLMTDHFYISAVISSISIAFISTLICLVIGYGTAYSMAKADPKWRPILLLIVILPFWTSFLVRIYAWISLLSTEGVINGFLLWLGIISAPLPLLYNTFSVVIGIVYCYLPFMVLPIYAVLEKIDPVYLEAAHDLGCPPWRSFRKITLPLSKPGVIAGCTLVFIPAIGEYVIPELLGAPETLMIGRVLWTEFFNNRGWPLACALAVVMLVIFVIPIMLFQRYQQNEREEVG